MGGRRARLRGAEEMQWRQLRSFLQSGKAGRAFESVFRGKIPADVMKTGSGAGELFRVVGFAGGVAGRRLSVVSLFSPCLGNCFKGPLLREAGGGR